MTINWQQEAEKLEPQLLSESNHTFEDQFGT